MKRLLLIPLLTLACDEDGGPIDCSSGQEGCVRVEVRAQVDKDSDRPTADTLVLHFNPSNDQLFDITLGNIEELIERVDTFTVFDSTTVFDTIPVPTPVPSTFELTVIDTFAFRETIKSLFSRTFTAACEGACIEVVGSRVQLDTLPR